ncbi:CbtB domain-containing protein [Tabrizicola sp.]|jgi:cobalt transporter subunit CbtB|uniref:CbtB domain-containing protein n=1 Tax=Tabrizicola sp. TaxID=2005166 RepID=UPI002FDE6CD7
MTTTTSSTRASDKTAALVPLIAMALLGVALIFAAGHAHSATIHDAAHDVRHASGFPCH